MPFTDSASDVVVQARAEADRLGLDRLAPAASAGPGRYRQGVAAQALNGSDQLGVVASRSRRSPAIPSRRSRRSSAPASQAAMPEP